MKPLQQKAPSPAILRGLAISGYSSPFLATFLLAFFRNFTEISLFVWGTHHLSSSTLWLILLPLGAYRVGLNSFIYFSDAIRPSTQKAILPLSSFALGIGIYTGSFYIITPAALFFGASMDSLRKQVDIVTSIPTLNKVIAKFCAFPFTLIGLHASGLSATFVAASLVFLWLPKNIEFVSISSKLPRRDPRSIQYLLVIEFFHQLQYFVYCYAFWVLLPESMLTWSGPMFVIGWLGYYVGEYIFRDIRPTSGIIVMGVGHVLNALALLFMANYPAWPILLIGFFITGVGGSSVYIIQNYSLGKPLIQADNAGVVVGVALCALLTSYTSNGTITTLLVGAICSMITAIYAFSNVRTHESLMSSLKGDGTL
jgi:hypothetical protein